MATMPRHAGKDEHPQIFFAYLRAALCRAGNHHFAAVGTGRGCGGGRRLRCRRNGRRGVQGCFAHGGDERQQRRTVDQFNSGFRRKLPGIGRVGPAGDKDRTLRLFGRHEAIELPYGGNADFPGFPSLTLHQCRGAIAPQTEINTAVSAAAAVFNDGVALAAVGFSHEALEILPG